MILQKKCNAWLEDKTKTKKALLTTSCTHALEMAALLIDIKEGDEVIMPSYTFASTANAFVLRGAKVVFVDIRRDTMNIDENLIEQAITEKTRAIIPVHYAGVGCEVDVIINIAQKYNLFIIEDAAQGLMSYYKGEALGAIGDIGAFSFHETKKLDVQYTRENGAHYNIDLNAEKPVLLLFSEAFHSKWYLKTDSELLKPVMAYRFMNAYPGSSEKFSKTTLYFKYQLIMDYWWKISGTVWIVIAIGLMFCCVGWFKSERRFKRS